MSLGNIEYVNLEALANADYKVGDGQADITGWTVSDESGGKVGVVKDLLFDKEQNAIRYVIIELDNSISGTENKAVLIPIGLINLADDKSEVVLPVMSEYQYNSMPPYIIGEVTRDMEVNIRRAIGSPAALRIEEEIVELEEANFYQHHHFDRGINVIEHQDSRLRNNHSDALIGERKLEESTIHQLVENSEVNQSTHKVEEDSSSNFNPFIIETVQGVYTIEPQENGTYRILNKGEKVGVIYAEAAQNEGVQWQTMDDIDEHFVNAVGVAISAHNSSSSNI